jgi:hypothetical protein
MNKKELSLTITLFNNEIEISTDCSDSKSKKQCPDFEVDILDKEKCLYEVQYQCSNKDTIHDKIEEFHVKIHKLLDDINPEY